MSQDNIVRMQCTACKMYNYYTHKNLRRQDLVKLERSKFCSKCRKHTDHKEKGKK